MGSRVHAFAAVAFEERLALKEIASAFPEGRLGTHELHVPLLGEGDVFLFEFGAVVFHDVAPEVRERVLGRLDAAGPKLTTRVVREDFAVREEAEAKIGMTSGVLTLDAVTAQRSGVVALTVAQSAAMEVREKVVEDLFARTNALVRKLAHRGTVPYRVTPLHRFIGEAAATRTDVLSVLHLLDKPDATWDDPAMDRIYGDLRAEFDLLDRYAALSSKLASTQEAVQLVLDVARDRRLVVLEATIVLLIVAEIVMGLMKAR